MTVDAVFLKIVNMSLTASWLVLAVVLLRLLLKKAPKSLRCVLWALVGVRLVCPFSIESALSLIPSAQPIPETIVTDPAPAINSGLPAVNAVVNPIISESFIPAAGDSVNPLQVWLWVAALLWLVGIAVLFVYAAVSFWRVRRQVGACLHLRENVYLCDGLPSPFILGVIRPRIYLPTGLDEAATAHIIAHEQAHLHRRDHWWKPLGFLLLTVHWFNPVMWVAYVLLCRDIELACDERVVRALDEDGKAAYSRTLLACGARRRIVAACPLAFGEVGVKARVKSVLNYKKPAFWIILAAVVAAIAVAVGFLTNPKSAMPPDGTYRRESTVCIVDNYYVSSFGIPQYVDWRVDDGVLYWSNDGESDWHKMRELSPVQLTEDNFDRLFDESLRDEAMLVDWFGSWHGKSNNAAKLRRQTKHAWQYQDIKYNEFVYLLETYDGDFYAAYGSGFDAQGKPVGRCCITKLATAAQDAPPPATGMYELTEKVCYLESEDYGTDGSTDDAPSLLLDNGMLYICKGDAKSKLGQLESVTLTEDNFDVFFKNPDTDLGKMVWNIDSSAAELRKNAAHAWRYVTTEGHPCYYYALQMKNGELLFCSGMDDTVIHNFFSVYRMKPVEGFCATVLEADKFTLLVEPFEGTPMRRIADKIEVPIGLVSYPVPELYEGDQLWIWYSGDVQETYPARLQGLPSGIVIIVGHRDPATIDTYPLAVMSTDNTHLEKVFTRDESDPNSYNVYYYAASSVSITLDYESMELKDALADGRITAAQLLAQAKKDVNAGVCRKELYDDGGSVEYRYGGYGLLLRYTDKESGDDTTGLFDVYVMPNGVSLGTLNDLLSSNHTTTTTQQVYTTTPHPSTNGITQTTTTAKPDTAKVNQTVILAIEGNTVIVDAAEHYIHRNDGRYQLYDRCAFDVSGKADIRDFKVGDEVRVIHTGEFTEDDPPRGHLLALSHIE